MNTIVVFLEIALEDIRASKALYEIGLYPQALFCCQQATEKVIKFIAIENNVIKLEDSHSKIGHKINKVFRKAMQASQQRFPSQREVKIEESFRVIEDEIVKFSTLENIPLIFQMIRKSAGFPKTLPIELEELSLSKLWEIWMEADPENFTKEKFDAFSRNPPLMVHLEKMREAFLESLKVYIESIMDLFTLSFLVESLVTDVRYPNIQDLRNPSEKYKSDHYLVSSLPFFHGILEMAIGNILKMKEVNV